GVPGIKGVWSHEAGGGRLLNVVSIQQMYPGHAKQVGLATASCHAGAYANRFVVVVDDDIDPTDTNQVLWALCTRTDVVEDVDVVKRQWSTPLDPMAYAGDGPRYFNNRMIIDACRPYELLAELLHEPLGQIDGLAFVAAFRAVRDFYPDWLRHGRP